MLDRVLALDRFSEKARRLVPGIAPEFGMCSDFETPGFCNGNGGCLTRDSVSARDWSSPPRSEGVDFEKAPPCMRLAGRTMHDCKCAIRSLTNCRW